MTRRCLSTMNVIDTLVYRTRMIIIMAVLMVVSVGVGSSQTGQWIKQSGPSVNFGTIFSLLETPPYLFAGSDSGIFRSGDGGVHWQEINSGITTAGNKLRVENIVQNKSGKLYISARDGLGTIAGVYASTDYGAHWSKLPNSLWTLALAIDSAQALITCSYNPDMELFRTTDDGLHWKSLDATSTYYSTQLIVSSTGDLYGFEDFLAWKYTFNTAKWTRVSPYPQAVHSIGLNKNGHIFIGADSMILGSSNDGASWDTLFRFPRYTSYAENISANGPDILVKERFRLLISTDTGHSWQYCDSSIPYHNPHKAIIGSSGSFYVGGEESDLFRSNDTGTQWVDVNNGVPSNSMYKIGYGQNNYVFAAGSGQSSARTQFYRSSDEGNTWTGIGIIPNLKYESFYSTSYGEIFVSPYPKPFSNADSGYYLSRDNGSTWYKHDFPVKGCSDARFVSDHINTVFAVTNIPDSNSFYVFASTDGGLGWTLRSTIKGRNSIIDGHNSISNFAIDPNNGIWIGMDSGVYRSTDAGNTWKLLKINAPFVIDSSGEVYFLSNNLYHYDQIRDTSLLIYRSPSVYASIAAAWHSLYLSNDTQVLVTADLGKTWNKLASQGGKSTPQPSGAFEYIFTSPNGVLWAAEIGVYKMNIMSRVTGVDDVLEKFFLNQP